MYRAAMKFLLFGGRAFMRDWRAGELRLLMVAITLAVAALVSVGFFVDRLKGGLQRDARDLLGGDALVVSDNPLPAAFMAEALALRLRHTRYLSFSTMAQTSARPETQGGHIQLVALKAVEAGYPLRGSLRTSTAPDAPDTKTHDVPMPGQVWVDAAVLQSLNLRMNDTVLLGNLALRMTRIIIHEPDRGIGFMNLSPRVMMNLADVAATGLVQPASRLRYQFSVAGDEAEVQAFVEKSQTHIRTTNLRGVQVQTLQNGRPDISNTLDRMEKFLNLVALLTALQGAVAVALAARSFAANHLDDCAMLRVLGLRQSTMAAAYGVEFIWTGLISSAAGVVLGFGIHFGFVALLAGLVNSDLPSPGLWPALLGMGMGLTLLLTFGLPPVLQLAQVPPLRVIRREAGQLKRASAAVLGLGITGFATLLMAMSSNITLGLIVVGGFAVAIVLFAALSWVAVKLLRRCINDATAPMPLVLATRQISARPAFAVVQVSSLAVGLLALVLLVLLRTDLISSWQAASSANAPNRFVINIMPEQTLSFTKALNHAGIIPLDWFPMMRGRLVAINGHDVNANDYQDDHARHLVDREFNLSYSKRQPSHNVVVTGRWRENEADAISIEEGIAKTLGLSIGDSLTFEMGGMQKTANITSLRKVDWMSMRANFFAMYPIDQLPNVPVTYMSAFKAPADSGFDHALVRQFPNITILNMTTTLGQIQRVLHQVMGAVEFLFAFTLAAGLVVMFAAITATREERSHEFAIMRAVGASAAFLHRVQCIELAGIGALAGFLASMVASVVGWALARFVFEFAWVVSLWMPLLGALVGGVLALTVGGLGLRDVLHQPVVQTLRKQH
jgi:putative ABC transport system permease protein